MRKKVYLYIGNNLVDLDTESLILFNYTMEDLSNPTIVKNSYSQQITLKGTPNNNAIFGDAFRLDRVNGEFDATRKTPFTIYGDNGSILESGYVKLDNIVRKGKSVEYKVTLYGGLGSFLYNLSYDENGDKRTLASLDYTGGGDNELNFSITRNNVLLAWENLMDDLQEGDVNYFAKWHIINFAPCYNGLPSGDFDAKKAIFTPSLVGLSNTKADGGVNYATKNGYSLMTMPSSHDEWAMKDLRSYLQRPVISMDGILSAIAKPENNGGYEVDLSAIESATDFPYKGLWMTLPMIPSLGSIKQTTEDITTTITPSEDNSTTLATYAIGGNFGSKLNSSLSCKLVVNSSAAVGNTLKMSKTTGQYEGKRSAYYFIQAVAYDSSNEKVGGSKVVAILPVTHNGGATALMDTFGYTPRWATDEVETIKKETFTRQGTSNLFEFEQTLSLDVNAPNVAKIVVYANAYWAESYIASSQHYRARMITSKGGGSTSTISLYEGANARATTTCYSQDNASSFTHTSESSLRSNALITKKMLLSSSKTPAEYLLSFCKIFGLSMVYDAPTRSIAIVRRNDLYVDETIDLTKRIDKSKDITITPMVFDSKWYDFELDSDGGAFYKEYEDTKGRAYGIQRVNTGYDFNADVKNLMDGNAFKNACTTLHRDNYFSYILQNNKLYPSIFMESGCKYSLYATSGSKDIDISVPSTSASVNYYNEYGHEGYDVEFARKLELCDSSNKGVTGDNILVYYEGSSNYPYFRVSDDLSAMDILNDGKPCWFISPGDADGVTIPIFQRYKYSGGGWSISSSLDLGMPSELDIPGITYREGITIYDKAWKAYLADRYDANTKVLKCKVNLGGLQVNGELLRKFYYYENTLWTLNKITNYSLTTLDAVECEFIQVQDKENYLNGQYNG